MLGGVDLILSEPSRVPQGHSGAIVLVLRASSFVFLASTLIYAASICPSWERFGCYVERCWLQDGVFSAILGNFWTCWQDAADGRKSWIFGGLEGGGGDATHANDLGPPP